MEVRLLLRTARGREVDLAGSWPSLADRAGYGERVDEGISASSSGCCGRTPADVGGHRLLGGRCRLVGVMLELLVGVIQMGGAPVAVGS
ncbi:hypothetical protein ACLOJK_037269 [Asimina triloba]